MENALENGSGGEVLRQTADGITYGSMKSAKVAQDFFCSNGSVEKAVAYKIEENKERLSRQYSQDSQAISRQFSRDSRVSAQIDDVQDRSKKIGKTTCFVFVWICMGLMASIDGPCLPDLRVRLNASMGQMSLTLAFRYLGIAIGSIVGGMLTDRHRRYADLIGALSLAIAAAATIIKPHVCCLPQLGLLAFLTGLGHGGIDSVGHAGVAWMWGKQAGPPMNGVHMGYPIGRTLAPLIAVNFLDPSPANNTLTTETPEMVTFPFNNWRGNILGVVINDFDSGSSDTDSSDSDSIHSDIDSRIEVPYGITGAISLTAALLLIILFIVSNIKGDKMYGHSKQNLKDVWSTKGFRSEGLSTKYTLIVMIMLCFFIGLHSGKNNTWSKFLFSFAIDELRFTKAQAAQLDMAFNGTAIFGRILCIILTIWCPIEYVLGISLILNAVFTTCAAFLGHHKHIYIWVFSCLFSLSSSPLWPSANLWAGRQIVYSSIIVGFFQISSSLFSFFSEWLAGYMYETFWPGTFMLYGAGCSYLMVILMSAMKTYVSWYKRHKKKSNHTKKSYADVWSTYSSTDKLESEVYSTDKLESEVYSTDTLGSEFTKL